MRAPPCSKGTSCAKSQRPVQQVYACVYECVRVLVYVYVSMCVIVCVSVCVNMCVYTHLCIIHLCVKTSE